LGKAFFSFVVALAGFVDRDRRKYRSSLRNALHPELAPESFDTPTHRPNAEAGGGRFRAVPSYAASVVDHSQMNIRTHLLDQHGDSGCGRVTMNIA
jgi:hypothetical protein